MCVRACVICLYQQVCMLIKSDMPAQPSPATCGIYSLLYFHTMSCFITMHSLAGCLVQRAKFPPRLWHVTLLLVTSPKLAAVREFCPQTLAVGHDASDLVPVGTGARFIKRSGNNCHLNVKSSGLYRDGIEK